MSKFPPTPEQAAILEAARDTSSSLMISAYAGCGKTSTIEMIAPSIPTPAALALAFNVKIKKELESRLPSHFVVKTLNGLGHSAWGRTIGKRCELDDSKLGKLVTGVLGENGVEASKEQWADIRAIADKARTLGLVPSQFPFKGLIPDDPDSWDLIASEADVAESSPLHFELAREVLVRSIKLGIAGTIDFGDQIYLSALFGGSFPKFPLVMVDEAQDLSPLNHIMVKRCLTKDSRLFVVGDPKQAIYAFRGADTRSMEKLRALRTDWIDLPLATTFRCPEKIVSRQQEHAPGFTAAPGNLAGKVVRLRPEEGEEAVPWAKVEALREITGPLSQLAVLCRNNSPIISLAFKLIRRGVGVVMLGRDIGRGLVVLSKKILPEGSLPRADCIRLINEWRLKEVSKLIETGKESRVAGVEDRAECLLAVFESSEAATAEELRVAIKYIFDREHGQVTLSSIHRSKGLEFPCVLHLDPWRIPSKFAKQADEQGDGRQLDQEMNLRYVCETRTKHTLILAALSDLEL